ncbi:hypothetical protein SEA_CLUBPENGUIN_65 [Streptomyces phage ClubPenguin]|nr:hypothetical protein SEA_CLUBPENGUIN_65 [Streptomyces phage ClubPenguin]
MSGRNAFDSVNPPISQEEALKYGGKMHSLLPPAPPGHHYGLITLNSGRVAVVIESD